MGVTRSFRTFEKQEQCFVGFAYFFVVIVWLFVCLYGNQSALIDVEDHLFVVLFILKYIVLLVRTTRELNKNRGGQGCCWGTLTITIYGIFLY